jgi:hypothetical protein
MCHGCIDNTRCRALLHQFYAFGSPGHGRPTSDTIAFPDGHAERDASGDIRVGTASWTEKTLIDCNRIAARAQRTHVYFSNNFEPLETRRALLGHKNGDITTHYSAPELRELIDAAERVCHDDFGKTLAMTLLKKKAVNGWAVNRLM